MCSIVATSSPGILSAGRSPDLQRLSSRFGKILGLQDNEDTNEATEKVIDKAVKDGSTKKSLDFSFLTWNDERSRSNASPTPAVEGPLKIVPLSS